MLVSALRGVAVVSLIMAFAYPAWAQNKPDAPAPSKAAPLGTSGAPKTDHPSGAMSAKKSAAKGAMSKGHHRKH